MQEMKVIIREIDQIRPYDGNPRRNEDAVAAVMKSLQEYGFQQPIVIDADGVIVAGHTRYEAAKELGLERVPVKIADELTPEQIRAYRLADNQTGSIAEWDMEKLCIELTDLQGDGYDLDVLGFDDTFLNAILREGGISVEDTVAEGNTDPDAVPAEPEEAITQPGDIWILGNHRLMCGDSASEEAVDLLLDGNTVQLCHTDPPYGVAVEPRSGTAGAAGNSSFPTEGAAHGAIRPKDRPIANDNIKGEEFDALLDRWFHQISRKLDPGCAFYIWGGYANLANYPIPLLANELYFSQAIVWDKQHPVIGRKDFMGSFELCFYGWRAGAAHRFFGPNNATDLWSVKKMHHSQTVHLTQKPVELAVRAIQYSSQRGENVLELFAGSGTTLIACEQTERRCFAMEIDPLYCDVIVKRWEDFTGLKAERISDEVLS